MNSLHIKYCGNKTLEDLRITADSNAQYLGFIFAKSKREVDPSELRNWLTEINANSKKLVGVFVNASIEEIASVVKEVPLSIIQCHGTESPQFVDLVKQTFNKEVWKVIHHSEEAIKNMSTFNGIVDGYVIDSKAKGLWGGSGQVFDWSYIPAYVAEAKQQGVPCLIAGGINQENLDKLLTLNIDGIDISSGIEQNDKKDIDIISKIEEKVKRYDTSTKS
ncbi:phosphoribosylanthranilate isomerase [Bacillus sp. PS06]|nr:phosphoribosylanthranilate isomerase [Bacillus sp. PS06]